MSLPSRKKTSWEFVYQLGHIHPLGVLHQTMTVESIILFWSADDIEHAAIHRAIKAMEFYVNKPIAIRATTPSASHTRAYTTVVGREPPKALCLPSEWEGRNLIHPLDNPHPGGETTHHLQAELGDLADHELHQLLEDLHQEVTLCEAECTPQKPSINALWGNPSRWAGILMQGDWEVTFPERGRMGSPRDNHSHQWPHTTRRRVGFPGTTIPTYCPHITGWGMGSSGTTSSTPNSWSA